MRNLSFLFKGLFLFIALTVSQAAWGELLPPPSDIRIGVKGEINQRKVEMGFIPVRNAISYRVTRAIDSPSSAFTLFAWVTANQFQENGNIWAWEEKHFLPGRKYFFKVATVSPARVPGQDSVTVVGPVEIPTLPPPAEPSVKLGSDGRVIINFSAVPGALKYKISFATDAPTNQFNLFAWVPRDTSTIRDRLFWSRDFFHRNKVYFFKVTTFDFRGFGGRESGIIGPVTTSTDSSRGIPAVLRIVNEDGTPLNGSSFEFSSAFAGSKPQNKRFVIKNEGTVDATIFRLSGISSPFGNGPLCDIVPARGSCNLDISFAAGVSGIFRNDLSILFDDGISWNRDSVKMQLAVSGQVTDPPLVTQVNPPVAASGQRVFLEGSGLNGVVSVEVGGVAVSAAPSLGKIVFTLPNGLNRGEKELKVNGVVQVPKIKIEPFCNPESVVSEKTESRNLAINDQSILNHANAKFKSGDLANSTWSFGYLMGRIAGFSPQDPDFETKTAQFVETWANTFQVGMVNGHNFGGRNFIGGMSWPRKGSGILDLENAPMRLIAIMYRPDLAEEGSQAGEGRFVYEVGGSSFTVILEYGLPINEANSAADWAKRWADLADHELRSPEYAEALKMVTSFFGDQRFSGRPNGSAINQVRTNEIALGSPWQLREWTLQSRDGGLENVALLPATVKQTPKPDLSEFDRKRLQNWWMNESCSGSSNPVEGCSDLMPSEFLAGAANTDGRSFRIGPDPVKFDMITCNGCHAPQITNPQLFVHVSRFGGFSNFLRSDLVQRRAAFRDALVNGFCK